MSPLCRQPCRRQPPRYVLRDPLQSFVEHLGQGEGRGLKDQARNRGRYEHDRRNAHQQRLVIRRKRSVGGSLRGRFAVSLHDGRPLVESVESAHHDGKNAGHDEGRAPAAVIDEIAGDEGGTGNAEIAPHAVHCDPHTCVLPSLGDDGESDGMIDRSEHTNEEQSDADLQRGLRHRCRDGRESNADEIHRDHAFAAPLVGKPACRQRKQAKGEEPRRRIFQQIAVANAPFSDQRQRRDCGEDQHEHVIQEVADVQKQKVDAIAIHACLMLQARK